MTSLRRHLLSVAPLGAALSLLLLLNVGAASGQVSPDEAPTVKCPRGYAFNDGCASAPIGVVQYPRLLHPKRVTLLNIIPGSGYTNGTYAWTSTGGGCTTPAAGTVRVVRGAISQTHYTIKQQGAGCTSRPQISPDMGPGVGGQIVPTVYHKRPPWNVPGVDYYVGIPAGTILKDPTVAGNLPPGATYYNDIRLVVIAASNTTLDGFDFCAAAAGVYVNARLFGTVIQNSRFCANPSSANGQNIRIEPDNGSIVIQQNEFDGKAVLGTGSGMDLEQAVFTQGHGTLTFQYNYCHDVDSKCIAIGTMTPDIIIFNERYNLFANVGLCQTVCAHGEAEYFFAGNSLATVVPNIDTNLYVTFWYNASSTSAQTSEMAVEADAINIIGGLVKQNTVLSPGPWGNSESNGDPSVVVGSNSIFYGQQEGGTMWGTAFLNNYLDFTGAYFPWYPFAIATGLLFEGNINAGTGRPCNPGNCK